MVAAFRDATICSLDLETTGLSPLDSRILLMQIGFPGGINFVIATHNVDISPLYPYLESPKIETLIHNAKFEQSFLLFHHNIVVRGVYDSKIVEHVLTGNQHAESSLAYCAKKYLDITLDKETRNSFIGMNPMEAFTDEQLEYAARDVDILFGIREAQLKLLEQDNLLDIAKIEFDLSAVVANMENVGVPVDAQKWRTVLADIATQHKELEAKITKELFPPPPPITPTALQVGMFGEDTPLDKKGKKIKPPPPPNLGSSKQVGIALEALGIKLPRSPKGNIQTNERVLANIKHPLTQQIVEWRGLEKSMTSYGEKSFLEKIHPFTGRIHANWIQIGTETGRFACEKPNLQQLSPQFRECIKDKELIIVVADYSQIELRIIAEMSGDEAMIAAFKSDYDLHTATAATMFGIDPAKVSKDERFAAKTINFGLAYGMGAPKLLDTLNAKRERGNLLTKNQVLGLISRHKGAFASAVAFLDELGKTAYRTGYSTTMLGRRRYFTRPDPNEEGYHWKVEKLKREGGNAPIQGTNADITKIAMVDLFDELRDYRYRANIILAVHDEIVVLAHKTEAESVKYLIEETMLRSAQQVLKRVPVAVDAFITDYWKKG